MPRRKPQKTVAVGSLPDRDPHDLMRFVRAQNVPAGPDFFSVYDTALGEIMSNGTPQADDWLDCVLPRLQSPGEKRGQMLLRSVEEARAFMEMPVVRNRFLEICEAMLLCRAECPVTLLGSRGNASKACSSLTLLASISERATILQGLLSGLFSGVHADDAETGGNDDPEDRARPRDPAMAAAGSSTVVPGRKRRAEGGGDGAGLSKRPKPSPAKGRRLIR